jgi:hypothetical protein
VEKTKERLGVSLVSFHTLNMNPTASLIRTTFALRGGVFKFAKIPSRRFTFKFRNPQFDLGDSTPLDQKPRVKKSFRKPKFKG